MTEISRKEFLHRSAVVGGCCGLAALASALPGVAEEAADAACKKLDPKFSTCQDKVDQGQKVIQRIISQMDAKLDKNTREQIMEACGRLCHGGTPEAQRKRTPEELKGFLEYMKKTFPVEESGDETLIRFHYRQNPRGLKPEEGYCLCPIFEVPPEGVSPTFCHCSVGYVTAIFEQGLGKPVKVELTQSVLRGGKTCAFLVRFKTA